MTQLSSPREYQNENGGRYSVREVTEKGEVLTYGGQILPVQEGDYVASTGKPDEYTKLENLDGLEALEPPVDEPSDNKSTDVNDVPTDGSFDPSKHNASTVHEYLSRTDISDEEYVRVRDAELAGKNRKSALPE